MTADGFTVELWRAVAAESQLNYTIRVLPFHDVLQEFKAGKIDVLINLAQSDERRKFADFTVPHVIVQGAIFIRNGEENIHSEADLNDKTIIVLNADLGNDYAVSKGWQKQLVLVDTSEAGFQLLSSGHYDVMLLSKLAGQQTLEKLQIRNVKMLPIKVGFEQKFSFAVQKGHAELLAKINEGLALTKTNGVYDKLYEKWFGVYEQQALQQLLIKYLLPTVVFFLLILSFVFYRRNVERQQDLLILQDSATHFRNTFEFAPIGIANVGQEGRFITVNQTFCNIMGYSRNELLTMTVRDITLAEDQAVHQLLIQQLFSGEIKNFFLEKQYRRKDQSLMWGSLSVQLNDHPDGKADYMIATVADITERKQMLASVVESESLLRTIIDTAPMRVFWKDFNLHYLGCNTAFAKDAGMAHPDELTGKDDYQMGWRDQAEFYRADDRLVMESGRAKLFYDEPQTTPAGQTIWLRTSKVPLKNQADETIGLLGIYEDITEHKQMERELQASEARLRSIVEVSPVPMALNDGDGRIIYLNYAFVETFGYELIDIPTLLDWWPKAYPDSAYRQTVIDTWTAEIRVVDEENKPFAPMEIKICCKNGEQKTVLVTARVLTESFKDEHLVVFYDITERKQMEEKLRESELHLQTIIDNEPECIKVVDAEGRLLQMNPAGVAMVQANSFAQIAGGIVWNLVVPQNRLAFIEMHKRVIAGERMQLEFEIIGLKGRHRWVETHAVPMLEHEKIVHLAVTRDVTKRKQAEMALLRSNADLEQFAYSVSHDMRQPLRSITGHLQLLARSLKDNLDEEGRENLDFALEGTKRMDAMIVSLLDYSRVGRKTDSKVWINSRLPLDEALEFLSPAIKQANAEIKITGEWGQVFASYDELSRLLMNVIGNAIKYHESDKPPSVNITSVIKTNIWRVSVCDKGIGINLHEIERLFQFFSRLQSRARFEGTGMGLALCKKIVEHHGGKIWVESAGEGQGSCFIFELPLCPSEMLTDTGLVVHDVK